MPNFIEISQTSLEKSITKIGPRTHFFIVTDRQRCDYFSHAVQRARGVTKNCLTKSNLMDFYYFNKDKLSFNLLNILNENVL